MYCEIEIVTAAIVTAVVLYAFVVASVVGAVLNRGTAVLKLAYVTVAIVVYIFSEVAIAVFRIFVFRHTCLSFCFSYLYSFPRTIRA
jgi:hypothetical protein